MSKVRTEVPGEKQDIREDSEDELGMLACDFEGEIYCDAVGAFGISCASEWWARLFGAALRAIFCRLGEDWPAGQLTYADDLEVIGAGKRGSLGTTFTVILAGACGFPARECLLRSVVALLSRSRARSEYICICAPACARVRAGVSAYACAFVRA